MMGGLIDRGWGQKKQHIKVKHKYDSNGNLEIKLSIENNQLSIIDDVFSSLLRTIKDARKYYETLKKIEADEADNSKLKRSDLKKKNRLALSVFKKTQSRPLAARASGLPLGEVRLVIGCAKSIQTKQYRAARNRHMRYLYDRGWSLRMVAHKYKLHHSTVQEIIARERRNNPNAPDWNVLPLFKKRRR